MVLFRGDAVKMDLNSLNVILIGHFNSLDSFETHSRRSSMNPAEGP